MGQFAYHNVLSLLFATSRHWQTSARQGSLELDPQRVLFWSTRVDLKACWHNLVAICISQCFVASVCHKPPLTDIGPPRKPRCILRTFLSTRVDLKVCWHNLWAICISQRCVASVCHKPPLTIYPPRKPRWILKDLLCPQESIWRHVGTTILGNLHITMFCRFSLPPAAIGRHWPAKEASLDPQRPVLSTRVDFWRHVGTTFGQFAYHNVLSLQFATSRHWQTLARQEVL